MVDQSKLDKKSIINGFLFVEEAHSIYHKILENINTVFFQVVVIYKAARTNNVVNSVLYKLMVS